MEAIHTILAQDRFCCDTVGIELIEVGKGRAQSRLTLNRSHLNGLGIVQGGAVFTLADYALAAAANSHGTAAVLINADISYMKGVSQGILLAEAEEESIHPKLATYTVRVRVEGGELIALMRATVYRKQTPLADYPAVGPEGDSRV